MLAKAEHLSHYGATAQQNQSGSATTNMTDKVSIDGFLAASVRSLRAGKPAPWLLNAPADWQEVWERIEYHGIPFVLHTNSAGLPDWPEQLLERIAEEARLMVLWETTHHRTVADLVEQLHRAGISSVLMKGTALAYSLHDEPATRRRGDTDLLVSPRHKDRTRAILKGLGWYRRDDPHGLYYQEGWLHDAAGFFVHSVDLHWEPSDRPVLQGIVPIDAFFSRKVAIPRFGEGGFRPDLPTMMLHATINQKWHALHGYDAEAGRLASPRRLIWSIDFELMATNMEGDEWEKLIDHCGQHGVGPLVADALRGMAQDLAADLPEGLLERLDRIPLNSTLAAYFADPDSLGQFWIDLREARTLDEKRRLITMRALPPRDHLIAKYPAARGWPTFLLQGRLLLETAGRAVRRAFSQ